MPRVLMLALLLTAVAPAHAQSPVFDMHVHLRDGAASAAAFEARQADEGVELRAYGAMWFGGPHQALEGQIDQVRAGNDRIIALAAANPKVVPIATVHPYDGEAALAELARVAGQGVKVLKIHPHTQRFELADPRVLALARRAGELGMVVLTDNAGIIAGDSQDLFNLALRAPDTQFVFAHMGGMDFRFWNVLALARTAEGVFAENLHFDISATAVLLADSPVEDEFVWTLRNVGIDRILLGSDHPQLSLGDTVDALDRLGLTAAETAKIRWGNAQRLFGLE